jgi:maltodextrin utilization protein YvdJ
MRKITSTQLAIRFVFLTCLLVIGIASKFAEKKTFAKEVAPQQVSKQIDKSAAQKMISALLF